MAVKIQFAGDKSIGVGSRPPGAFSLFKPPGAAFPPAGSYNSTLFGETYPVAQGGTDFANPVTSASVPNQICDVDVLNDGSGGTYIDWSSATNVQYKANGVVFYTDPTQQASYTEVPSGSGNNVQNGTYNNEYFHDGTGSWSSGGINQSYYMAGTDTYIESLNGGNQQTEVPSGSGNYYDNGQFDGYTWDGSGGYNYPVTKGTYFPNGDETGLTGLDVPNTQEVPIGSSNYYNTGEVNGYEWNGSGGYNYVQKESQYPTGTLIFWGNVTSTSSAVEVPTGNGVNYFDSYVVSGDIYTWDFLNSPPYVYASSFYYPSGTFITNDGTYDYYWDGSGGYYT